MGFLGDLLGLGANVASGGLFGLLGSLIGVGAKWLQAKQAAKAKISEWQHEIKLLELQMEAGDRETENELAISRSEGSWKGLSDSYHNNAIIPASAVPAWANAIRSLFRPFLTISLWILVVIELSWMLNGTLEVWISDAKQFGITINYIIDSTVFSAATATTWWFGDRAFTPPGQKAR